MKTTFESLNKQLYLSINRLEDYTKRMNALKSNQIEFKKNIEIEQNKIEVLKMKLIELLKNEKGEIEQIIEQPITKTNEQ